MSAGTNANRTVVSIVVEEDDYNILHDREERQSRTVRTATAQVIGLLSIIYGILIALLGVLFALAAALQDKWLDMHSEGVYAVYVYIIAIAFLLVLQLYIIPRSKRNHLEAEKKRMESVRATIMRSSVTHEQTTQYNIVPNKREKQLLRISSTLNVGSPLTVSPTMLKKEKVASKLWVDVNKLNDAFAHQGSTFYLRLGTLVFGLGNTIYVGMEIHYHLILPVQKHCGEELYAWKYVLRLIFILVQTFFLLKNAQAHVTVLATLSRFGFMHLLSANFYLWFRTLVAEILHEMPAIHDTPNGHVLSVDTDGDVIHHVALPDNHRDKHVDNGHHGLTTPSDFAENITTYYFSKHQNYCNFSSSMRNRAAPFLFPFILEYSLIAAGVFALMSSEIGKIEPSAFPTNLKLLLHKFTQKSEEFDCVVDKGHEENSEHEQVHGPLRSTGNHGPVTFKRSYRGMYLGFVLLGIVIVSTVVFFFELGEGSRETALCIFYFCDIFTHGCLMIASVSALVLLNRLPLKSKPMSVDDTILLISMCGACFLELAQFLSISTFLLREHVVGLARTNAALATTDASLSLIQTVVQVVLIISGLRRYTVHRRHNRNGMYLPGRDEITFLIITNVTVWVYRSIHTKELAKGVIADFYGEFAWLLLVNVNLPFLLFFRFHSSVCFAEIWSSAYTPRKLGVQVNSDETTDPRAGYNGDYRTRDASLLSLQDEEKESDEFVRT